MDKKKVVYSQTFPLIICGLFSLLPENTLFNKCCIKSLHCLENYSFLKEQTERYLLLVVRIFSKAPVREIAFKLYEPVLKNNADHVHAYHYSENLRYLKQYLKKFRFIYYQYLNASNDVVITTLTTKQINNLAFYTLLLIMGL